MANFLNFSSPGTVVLDGGFGTTLEQVFRLDISNTPLWSAIAVVEYPDIVVQTHLAFLRAGANVISTSTYQCSWATFKQAGYSPADARRIMSTSIKLAGQARRIFREEQIIREDPVRDVRIALSLGPFGATLSPAQEFDGFYPPPFGPKKYSANVENCNTFGHDEAAEAESIRALAQFHFERLVMVFEDAEAWKSIDCLAFETVPLTREIKAIRQAMGLLNERIVVTETSQISSTNAAKPWWLSMVFPDGVFPETTRDGRSKMSISDVVSSATGTPSAAYPRPSALGINCTQVEYLPKIISQLEDSLKASAFPILGEGYTPWLILYPNGGDVYDSTTQTWTERRGKDCDQQWAGALKASYTPSDVWAGVIFGGCCRTTPMHIQLLRQAVDSKV
ncbi:hypothetical protein GYMLUDRAFT_237185 [Collybiopsis luxurians FD-317 M1]|nr:hypothetical protein GYMLUDRAFT_237185 [Collybiopsis luxurians FD-317 M1]